ncbi:phospho-N-acetylmuramoyl-pentapeptide-transferase [Candidatus Sneabacter namystus]|nr:phospho-N-acetylmuramoyl-pentapeptide-transferase [Candidatus Sneabacter namystus]
MYPWILLLRRLKFYPNVRNYLEHHRSKSAVPNLGGVIVFLSAFIVYAFLCKHYNVRVFFVLGIFFTLFLLGLYDDVRKYYTRGAAGLSARSKFVIQIVVAFTFCILLRVYDDAFSTFCYVPFLGCSVDFGVMTLFLSIGAIVSSANAVNITDGLDGLATLPVIFSFSSLIVIACSHHGINFISREEAIIFSSYIGSCFGFLVFNYSPAKIFLGDCGSLSLGGGIAALSIITQNQLAMIIVCGIFVIETASVIIQIIYFRYTGKRIFLMSPLHHHFEKKGIEERKIVIGFWIAAFVFAVFGASVTM